MCCLQEYLQIVITLLLQLGLNFSSIAPTSASFTVFRSRLFLNGWDLCEISWTIKCTDRLNHHFFFKNLLFSIVLFSCIPPLKTKCQHLLIASYYWCGGVGTTAEQLGSAYMIIWDAKLQAYRQEKASTPLCHCSYCVALCVAWRSGLTV